MPSVFARTPAGATNLLQWNSKQNDSASSVNAANIVLKIRTQLRQSAVLGFVSFLQNLKQLAHPVQGLSRTQLKRALDNSNIPLSDVEIRAIALFIGDETGLAIPVIPLRDLIFGKLEGRRLELATRAFDGMDARKQGYVSVDDILRNHDAQMHPDIMFGCQNPIEIHSTFVKAFTSLVPPTSLVNLTQWLEYCQCLSATTEKGDYFELIMTRVWHVSLDTNCNTSTQSNQTPSPRTSFTLLEDLSSKNLLSTAPDPKYLQPAQPEPQIVHSTLPSTQLTFDGPSKITARMTSRNATLNSSQAAACMTNLYVDRNALLPKPKDISVGTKMILSRLRASLKSRGAVGIVGLSRKFRIMDDDNNGSLSLNEFKKAMKECQVDCSEADLRLLFDSFDKDESQSIDFKEFLNGIREPMNERRLALVQAAFKKIDRNGDGVLEPSDIVGCYDASKHPDVIAGKRTEDSVFREFLDTFDVDVKDGKVTKEEWEHYYHNISSVIDNDDYFELMMRNAWQLSGGQGWAASSFEHNQTRGVLLDESSPIVFTTPKRYGNASAGLTSCLQVEPTGSNSHTVSVDMQHPRELRRIVRRLKTTLKSRGGRGYTGLACCFRIMDTNGSGSLDLNEFRTAMDRMQLHVSANDVDTLFDYFDTDGSGSIQINEFAKGIRDPMNDRRLLFVHMAFDLLDTDKNHVLTIDEVVNKFDGQKHPDVLAGRRTDREILAEFLETFESSSRVHDGQITLAEWTEYYANISASIDDDDYFELMMRNAWHISGGEGWCANSSNRRVLINDTQVVEIQNDLGVKRYEELQQRLGKQGFGSATNPVKLSFFDVLDHSSRPVEQTTRQRARNNSSSGTAVCLTMGSPRKLRKANSTGTKNASNPIATVGVQPILSRLQAILKTEQHGFIGLSRAFRRMDSDGNGHLSMMEFKEALASFGISDVDARILFNYFDLDHNGSLEIQEFVAGLRGPLNARRLGFVRQAFQLMDKDGNGVLEPSDIVEAYDASKHPEVIAGRKTPEQVFREFLDTFDVDGHHDAKITPEMWEHYYASISAGIDDDDYFELMMRNAWHISGGSGWCANTTNKRVLVNDTQVVEIQNDLGMKSKDIPARLEEQIKSYLNQPGTIKALNSVNVTACLNHSMDGPKAQPPSRLAAKIVPLHVMHSSEVAPPIRRNSGSSMQLDGVWGTLRQELKLKGLPTVVQLRRGLYQYGKTIAATQIQAALSTIQINLQLDVVQKLVDDARNRFPPRGDDAGSKKTLTNSFWKCFSMEKDAQLGKMIKRIYAHLQVEAKGECTPLILAKAYDAPNHPAAIMGMSNAEDIFKQFAASFDVDARGSVSLEALETYCYDLFLSVGEVGYCLQVLRDCFHVEIPS